MPYCNQCGNRLPDDSKFCIRCGAKLDTRYQDSISQEENGSVIPPSQDSAVSPSPQNVEPENIVELPSETIVNEGSLKGEPYLIHVWILRVAAIGFILMMFVFVPEFLDRGLYFEIGSITLVTIVCIVGSDWVYRSMKKRLSEITIKPNGIQVSSIAIYRGIFRIKEWSIPISEISNVEKTYISDDLAAGYGYSNPSSSSNTLVVYLKDGKIKSFVRRDPKKINLAYLILTNKYLQKVEGRAEESNEAPLYRNYPNATNWRKEWTLWFAAIMLIGIIAMMSTLLYKISIRILNDSVRPMDIVLGTMIVGFIVAFIYIIYTFYRSLSINSVDISTNGVTLHSMRKARTVPWNNIFRIESARAESVNTVKQRSSALYTSKKVFFRIDYEIGQAIHRAYYKNVGRKAPSNLSDLTINNIPVAQSEYRESKKRTARPCSKDELCSIWVFRRHALFRGKFGRFQFHFYYFFGSCVTDRSMVD